MDKCKYSVIVPVFNSASLLPRCVESVLAQELCDFELLLIDDGSTDESGSICDNYAKKDSRIIVIHQENAGVSNARNAGLEIAKGMYITFLDSDDWIGPKYLLDFDNDESDYICHSFTTYSEDDTIIQTLAIKEEHASTSKENILRFMEDGYMGYPFAKRFKSTIIRQNGLRFMSNISHTEDTIFIFSRLDQIASHITIVYICPITRINQFINFSLSRHTPLIFPHHLSQVIFCIDDIALGIKCWIIFQRYRAV